MIESKNLWIGYGLSSIAPNVEALAKKEIYSTWLNAHSKTD